MINHRFVERTSRAQRICEVKEPRHIDLREPGQMLELFFDLPQKGYFHLLRYVDVTDLPDARLETHGLRIAQADRPDGLTYGKWCLGALGARILCDVDLGQRRHRISPRSGLVLETEGELNAEPLLIVNFPLATETMMRIIDGRPARWPGARRRHQVLHAGAPKPLAARQPLRAPYPR